MALNPAEKISHTPGPWTAATSIYDDCCLVVKAGMPTNRVLARFGSDAEPLDDTDRANARLIAAAPDMRDALATLLELHDALGAGQSYAATKARAALTKASRP